MPHEKGVSRAPRPETCQRQGTDQRPATSRSSTSGLQRAMLPASVSADGHHVRVAHHHAADYARTRQGSDTWALRLYMSHRSRLEGKEVDKTPAPMSGLSEPACFLR